MAAITPERLAIARQCIADGWPLIQIYRTHRIGRATLRRHFPDYHGMPLKEAASLGAAARRFSLQTK